MRVTAANRAGIGSTVFLFANTGLPRIDVVRASPPFYSDPAYRRVAVRGTVFWQVVLHGGTGVDPNGGLTYTGSGRLRPSGGPIVEVVRIGDFEAVSTWVIGTDRGSCLSVVTSPGRIEILVRRH